MEVDDIVQFRLLEIDGKQIAICVDEGYALIYQFQVITITCNL